MKIKAEVEIKATPADLFDLFKKLSTGTELYKMETHEGIFPVKGELEKPGSIFYTKEQLGGIPVKLYFKVVTVRPPKIFTFKLIKPLKFLNINGAFEAHATDKKRTRLTLQIYQAKNCSLLTKILAKPIFLFPMRNIVKPQIAREVKLIKDLVQK